MYGVVLMAALSQSTAVPDLGRRGGGGCCGCYGGGYGGCYGGGWGGGWGGCYGGGWGGCYGGGMGYGGGWGGCYGGGMGFGGCYGGGMSMGYGGCFGGGMSMGYGGCFGGGMSMGYGGCSGGGYPIIGGGQGMIIGGGGGVVNPGQMNIAPGGGGTPGTTGGGTKIQEDDKPGKGGRKKTTGPDDETRGITEAPVTIVVSLPADAQLFFDDQLTQSSGSQRTFTSPALEIGRTYHYELKSVFTQDGKVKTVTRSVPVVAGETTYVTVNASTRQVVSVQR